jgi:cation diffusion facilitator CzcD-associated flavoprotein CzcO
MTSPASEDLDVVVVGAGLSGISAAWHLQDRCPDLTWSVLEAREAMGGTWDLFRYPGIRSDSDMYTLGYRFRPWRDAKAIADGPAIKAYIEETARECGIAPRIRFRHRVVRAEWSSTQARWTLHVEVGETRRPRRITCRWLYGCTGYYRYDEGYTPAWPGVDRYEGELIHPQHWPQGLDYAGRSVVVIGSGATAVTLVPALARGPRAASHVTMLQRSPTYIVSQPGQDRIANALRRLLPERLAYAVSRWKNVVRQMFFFQLARRSPRLMKRLIRSGVRSALGEDYDVGTHFAPRYDPWDERLCLAPDGDFFTAIREGRASVVTDHVAEFTPEGVRLRSGRVLEADIVVAATGLRVELFSGVALVVDGEPVDLSSTLTYKGMMYSDVPNLCSAFGYTNASWTLKCDLVAEHVCRILNHMERNGLERVVPRCRDGEVERDPALDLTSGYIQRVIDELPGQGTKLPWRLHQNYVRDLLALRYGRVDEPELEFRRRESRSTSAPTPAGPPISPR